MATNHLWPSTCTDTQLSIVAETAPEAITRRPGHRRAGRLRVGRRRAGRSRWVCVGCLIAWAAPSTPRCSRAMSSRRTPPDPLGSPQPPVPPRRPQTHPPPRRRGPPAQLPGAATARLTDAEYPGGTQTPTVRRALADPFVGAQRQPWRDCRAAAMGRNVPAARMAPSRRTSAGLICRMRSSFASLGRPCRSQGPVPMST